MLRAFENLCTVLIREGAPALRRETGSAQLDALLVSVAAPWQETTVRIESMASEQPFIFTKAMMSELAAKDAGETENRRSTGRSVISTLLNGYEVADPFNKKATRAELVVLSSSIDSAVADALEAAVRKTFHRHDADFVSFAPVSYAVFRDLYPHEKDYLILDVSGEGSDVALVKGGRLVDVGSVPTGVRALLSSAQQKRPARAAEREALLDPAHNAQFSSQVAEAEQAWLQELAGLLKTFAAKRALPRTLFLLADDDARDFLVRTLNTPVLHALWLSDEPLRIVPVLPAQLTAAVETKGTALPDIFLAVLAAYSAKEIEPLSSPGPLGSP